jgi:O-acetyl-ADP-ribose deacetylase (regulator of RNase III)
MILRNGNVLREVKRGIILQQVNAQGMMGSGIAKEIRERWPQVWEDYAALLGPSYTQKDSGRGFLGRVIVTEVENELFIASIVGQQFFGRDKKRYTSYDALDEGTKWLQDIVMNYPVHHPLLGCGLGGGSWPIVAAIIADNLGDKTTLWVLPPS